MSNQSLEMSKLTENQQVQEEQYKFPYHYADLISDKHKYFKSIEPLDLLRQVKEKIGKLGKNTILDAGCGDARLIYELRGQNYTLAGMDYSVSAVAFARAFNPGVEFYSGDFRTIEIPYKFDIVVLMEVLEHFVPEQIDAILKSIAKMLKPDGKLIITVPSTNMKLSDKHYQHFTSASLAHTIKSFFEIEEVSGYAKNGIRTNIFNMLRNLGNLFYPFRREMNLAKTYFNYYKKYYEKHVATGEPEDCKGLLAVCKKVN